MSERKKQEYVSIHVRIINNQYEFLRKYSYEKRVSQAEVIREALEMYREALERRVKHGSCS